MDSNAPFSAESVFHYTNARGLIGIIRSHRLWATESSSLNDHAEMLQGWRFARAWLESRPSEPIYSTMRSFVKDVDDRSAQRDIFVLAASRNRDDASQWRLYANAGCGYSIELDTSTPFYVVSPDRSSNAEEQQAVTRADLLEVSSWTDVIYNATDKEALLESIAQSHAARMRELERGVNSDCDEAWENWQDDLFIALHEAVAKFKEPGFAGENEVQDHLQTDLVKQVRSAQGHQLRRRALP